MNTALTPEAIFRPLFEKGKSVDEFEFACHLLRIRGRPVLGCEVKRKLEATRLSEAVQPTLSKPRSRAPFFTVEPWPGDALSFRPMAYIIRKATLADRPAIQQLIAESARGLSRNDYSEEQIEGAIKTVFGVDTNLILDGTYFVADNERELIGCGGWSKRKTLFGGDQYESRDGGELDPKTEAAKIRAFFIHPAHARKGIARSILNVCEAEAKAAGFQSLELMSTLPGIKLYRACGFEGTERIDLDVGVGLAIGLVPMRKRL
jgi:N-acetylglutamate synthase and related acetyltransferases